MARRRLLRYYLVGADAARRKLRAEQAGEPAMAERFPDTVRVPVDTHLDAAEWIEQEWTNLLAVVESGLAAGQDEEIVQLARMASEFAEGTRTLGPLVLSRAVRIVV